MHSVVDLPPSSLLSVSSYLGLFPPLPLLITCNQLSSLKLGSQKTSPSRDWNADLTVEDGLFPTSIIWNSPSSTISGERVSQNSSFECLQLDVTPRVKAERERKDFAKALRNMNQRVDDLHTENVERLADMTKKMDRAIKSDGKFQIQLDNIRESVDAIGVAFVQFGMDDEKNKASSERNLARTKKCYDDMAKE
ncbi:hypothetical protein JADG_007251 [Aureobasidium aubasidani]|nr:hypothetical protein JADG_007251 [Aureobasidium pullulans]